MTAKLISDGLARNTAIKVRVLRLIQAGPVNGDVLIADVEAFSARVRTRVPEYDFVHWMGTTIFALFRAFLESEWMTCRGPRPYADTDFYSLVISPTDRTGHLEQAALQDWGQDFIDLLDLLA